MQPVASPPIRVGVVDLSAAGWARVLEPALLRLPDTYHIVAVSTTNAASAHASAQRLSDATHRPVTPYHGDTSHIAADPNVDFVVVSVKAPEHFRALMPVIQAKKPCFVEWPVGSNLSETTALADAAAQNRVRTIVGLQGRQSPVLLKAKELIASGKIGRMLSCSVIAATHEEILFWGPLVKHSVTYTTKSASGASLLDVALGHHLDTVLLVLGTELTSVMSTSATMYPTVTVADDQGKPTDVQLPSDVPDHIALHGTLANGALLSVSFLGGYKSTPGRHRLLWVIEGETGSLRLENDEPAGSFVQLVAPRLYLNGELFDDDDVLVPASSDDYLTRILAAQFAEFAKGDGGEYADLRHAVKLRRVLDAIARSGKTRVEL